MKSSFTKQTGACVGETHVPQIFTVHLSSIVQLEDVSLP